MKGKQPKVSARMIQAIVMCLWWIFFSHLELHEILKTGFILIEPGLQAVLGTVRYPQPILGSALGSLLQVPALHYTFPPGPYLSFPLYEDGGCYPPSSWVSS